MHIQGLNKLSLIDYPEHLACVLFAHGCNLRCPFCHNAPLVTFNPASPMDMSVISDFLEKRKGILEGICLTGGEPLMQKDCLDFLRYLRKFGFKIKLDTNGFFPKELKIAIDEKLVDYIAMDIKACKENYPLAVGNENIDISPIYESIDIIKNSSIDYEFRTTAVKGLHKIDEFSEIANWIKGAKKYFIQQFSNSGDLISNKYSPFSQEEMNLILKSVKDIIPESYLRGI